MPSNLTETTWIIFLAAKVFRSKAGPGGGGKELRLAARVVGPGGDTQPGHAEGGVPHVLQHQAVRLLRRGMYACRAPTGLAQVLS